MLAMIKKRKPVATIGNKIALFFITKLILDQTIVAVNATKTRVTTLKLAYHVQFRKGDRVTKLQTQKKIVVRSSKNDVYFIDQERELDDTKPKTLFEPYGDLEVSKVNGFVTNNDLNLEGKVLDSSSKFYFSNIKKIHDANGKGLLFETNCFDDVDVSKCRHEQTEDSKNARSVVSTKASASYFHISPSYDAPNAMSTGSVSDDETQIRSLNSGVGAPEVERFQMTSKSSESIGLVGSVNERHLSVIENKVSKDPVTLRSLWQQRQARSAEEGIRREKTNRLADVLGKVRDEMLELENRKVSESKKFAARTITGFINALAEDVDGLEVKVKSNSKTPFWKKQVDDITIQFSRLGFKPLRISGGVLEAGQRTEHFQARSLLGIYDKLAASVDTGFASNLLNSTFQTINSAADRTLRSIYEDSRYESPTADEAFDRIDIDNSGSLDRDELVQALNLAAVANFEDLNEDNQQILQNLATDLVQLYDFNGDGVVDRKEYKSMVEDMAELRQEQIQNQYQKDLQSRNELQKQIEKVDSITDNKGHQIRGWFGMVAHWFVNIFRRGVSQNEEAAKYKMEVTENEATDATTSVLQSENNGKILDSPEMVNSVAKSLGTITISDVKLDLRQLLFGAVPLIKHITPGGPLVLEPFTVTVNGSFKRNDIRNSFLLDAALRRLVARVIRIRTGSVRDFLEGAVFHGRSWRMFGESGPKVEIPELTDVDFDNNKLVITGRARIRTSPGAPVVEQTFKVRTSIGTRQNGRFIRLEEPELALVLECPKSWERNIAWLSDYLNIKRPPRPKPLYSFFPIYSPFKMNEDDGFDLGEDNTINSLYIHDGALCFEMSSVLRPGRFLGSHYLAFSIPNRTFIVTVDRVVEGIKAARKSKRAAMATKTRSTDMARSRLRQMKDMLQRQSGVDVKVTRSLRQISSSRSSRGFFGRFVDGYLQAERDESKNEQITSAIRDYFGRQALPSSFNAIPKYNYSD